MEFELPKTDAEYIEELDSKWGVDIVNDSIIGIFKMYKDGKWGYFDKCYSNDNKKLFVPGNNRPLRVNIIGNSKEHLTVGRKYSFKLSFDKLSKRIQIGPYLFVTHLHTIKPLTSIDDKKSIDLKEVIQEIYNEKLQQNNPFNIVDMAEAVDSLSIDIYSENKRFIYELIQNADDSSLSDNSELLIEIIKDYIVVSHNGKPFDEKDLRGLCGIGRGTKQNDASKTGYKGIGFKSVFGQKDGLVYVKTGDLLFKFDREQAIKQGWNDKWGSLEEWEYKYQLKFKSPWQLIPLLTKSVGVTEVDHSISDKNFNVKTVIKIERSSELEKDINQLFGDARFMLFLRKISTIRLKTAQGEKSIQKEFKPEQPDILTLKKNEKFLSNWYVKRIVKEIPEDIKQELKADLKSPKKLQTITHSELSFALKVNKAADKIEELSVNDSIIYTYLPTSVKEYGLSFLVNSNFLVDASREKLHKDRIWNKWLFSVIGYELVLCCSQLALSKDLNETYLKVLANDFYLESDSLRKWFNKGLKRGINDIPLIVNNRNKLVLIKDAVLDETEIIHQSFITAKHLSEYINNSTSIGTVNPDNIVSKFNGSRKLINFGLKVFDDSLLKAFIKSTHFYNSVNRSLNFEFLNFLKASDESDKTGEWNFIIRNNPFILSSKGKLEKIPLVCFPISEFSTDFGSENTLIDNELYQKISAEKELYQWLSNLGVSEPSEIAFLEQEIIGKIDEIITSDNWLVVSEFILKLHKNGKLSNIHYNELQELKLKTDSGFELAKSCYLHADYRPEIDFNKYLDNVAVVTKDYIGSYDAFEWKSFFIKINVSDDINFIKYYKIRGEDFGADYKNFAVERAKRLDHEHPHLLKGHFFNIGYFSFFNDILKYAYSKVFWNRVIEKFTLTFEKIATVKSGYTKESMEVEQYKLNGETYILADLMPWGYYGSSVYVISYINYFLKFKKAKCIPTLLGKNVQADIAFANTEGNLEIAGNYLPIIDVKLTLSKDWIQFLGIKQKFDLDDYLIILSKISEDLYNHKIKKDNTKRLGLVYNELSHSINNFSTEDEELIKTWVNQNLIICQDKKPRRVEDIYWLRIDGFEDSTDKIPALLIPPNVSINNDLEKLFNLMGVNFVDECEYLPKNKKENINLKIKVLEIIPAVCLLLKSKLRIDSPNQFLLETYDLVNEFKFFNCSEISLILNYNEEKIKGAEVSYYLDKASLYFTTNWRNPIDRYHISKQIATIIKSKGLDQEIQLLLELDNYQITEYLLSQGLDISNIQNLQGYIAIKDLISNIKQVQNREVKTHNQETHYENAEVSEVTTVNEEHKHYGTQRRFSYNEDEFAQLSNLFGRELDHNELEEENLFAQMKALKYFEGEGYDVSKAEANFKNTYKNKYLHFVKDVEGNSIDVLCRSARNGILFFGAYAWVKLEEKNTILYLLTGEESKECMVIKSQQDLEEKLKSDYKVIRRSNTNFVDVSNMVEAETSLSDLQFLYKVKDGGYNIVFNPQKNMPGITEGGLIDEDI
jgi:hypothetical protein